MPTCKLHLNSWKPGSIQSWCSHADTAFEAAAEAAYNSTTPLDPLFDPYANDAFFLHGTLLTFSFQYQLPLAATSYSNVVLHWWKEGVVFSTIMQGLITEMKSTKQKRIDKGCMETQKNKKPR